MPKHVENSEPSSEPFNLSDALKASGVIAVEGIPDAAQPPQTPPDVQGGAFLASNGRVMHKYTVDGETIILPKPIEDMTEEDFYQLPVNWTDTLSGRLPQTLTVKFRDPQWAGHWFNRKAQDGRRVSEALALGYQHAKREDCEWICHSLNDADGAVIDNDLVLMKIHKAKLFMQYKQWMDIARIKGQVRSYKNAAEGATPPSDGKVEHYLTPQATKEFSGLGPVVSIPTAT